MKLCLQLRQQSPSSSYQCQSVWLSVKANDTLFNIVQLLLINKCWTLLRHVEYSFNFCWSTTAHFGAKLKWRTRKCWCRFVLRALSPLLQGKLAINEEEKSWIRQTAWQTITWTSQDLLTRCSEVCCNLYQSFVSHVTIFVILRSYMIQAHSFTLSVSFGFYSVAALRTYVR